MPVTFQVASHPARPLASQLDLSDFDLYTPNIESDTNRFAAYREKFLKSACYKQWKESGEILQSSLSECSTLIPRQNGFVNTVIAAYAGHHHLTMRYFASFVRDPIQRMSLNALPFISHRPDDVWMAILGQLSFYVNAHAEELRSYFVAHEGQKTLTVSARGTRYTVDFGNLARQMARQIHDHVVDKTLVEWILPDFSTSTVHDTTICSVLLMSTLQSYFRYSMHITCGMPSVTLQGEKEDWEQLCRRLDRLPELGDEPAQWATMLRPILRRFVDAFDGSPDIDFWNHVAYHSSPVCGQDLLSGWITAFCVWTSKGVWNPRASGWESPATTDAGTTAAIGSVMTPGPRSNSEPTYTLDGVRYFSLDRGKIPEGYCEVPVDLHDNGESFDCKMVAGNVASRVSQMTCGGPYDTLSPAPQWFMYVKAETPRRGYEEEQAERLEATRQKYKNLNLKNRTRSQ